MRAHEWEEKEAVTVEKKHPKGYAVLKKRLLENLKARGLVEAVYVDKVAEYMTLWEIAKHFEADIAERGVTVYDSKRELDVENRSCSLLLQTSKQMLAIFAALGFKDEAVKTAGITSRDADDAL